MSAARLCAEAAAQSAADLLSACCRAASSLDSVGCFCLSSANPSAGSGLALNLGGRAQESEPLLAALQGISELAEEACSLQVALPGSAACAASAAAFSGGSSADDLSAVKWNFAQVPPGSSIVPAEGAPELDGIVMPYDGPYAVQFGAQGPGGEKGGAASFDGVMAHVEVPYSPLMNPVSLSVRAVVQPREPSVDPRAVPGGATPQGVATSWSSSGLGGWSLERQAVPGAFDAEEARWVLVLSTPAGIFKLAADELSLDGAWYDIVGTYDPQTRTAALYVNGELAAPTQTLPSSMIGNPDGPLWLAGGGRPLAADSGAGGMEYSRPYSGLVKEVEIFNEALEPSVVRGLHGQLERSLALSSGTAAATAFGVVAPTQKKTSGALPSWAIAVIVCGFVGLAAAMVVGLIAFRRAFPKTPRDVSARTNQWRKTRSASHASNMAHNTVLPGPNCVPSTPRVREDADIPPGMPKFEKVGSRVAVTWVDPTDAIANDNNLSSGNDLTEPLSPKTHAVGFNSYRGTRK